MVYLTIIIDLCYNMDKSIVINHPLIQIDNDDIDVDDVDDVDVVDIDDVKITIPLNENIVLDKDVEIVIQQTDDLANFNLIKSTPVTKCDKYVCSYCNQQINLIYEICYDPCNKCNKYMHRDCFTKMVDERYLKYGCGNCNKNIHPEQKINNVNKMSLCDVTNYLVHDTDTQCVVYCILLAIIIAIITLIITIYFKHN